MMAQVLFSGKAEMDRSVERSSPSQTYLVSSRSVRDFTLINIFKKNITRWLIPEEQNLSTSDFSLASICTHTYMYLLSEHTHIYVPALFISLLLSPLPPSISSSFSHIVAKANKNQNKKYTHNCTNNIKCKFIK